MFKSRKIFAIVLVTSSILLSTFSFYLYQVGQAPNFQVDKAPCYLYIPTGATFQTVLDSLKKNRIIENELSFAFLSKLLKYQEKVKPGRYLIEKNMNNRAAIRMLRGGHQTPVKLTFNNIRTKEDLVKRLTQNLELTPEDLYKFINNPAKAQTYGFDTTTIVCMFLPDTYEVYWTTSAENLLKKIQEAYQKFWTEAKKQKAAAIGLTPVQIAVLASIVQAETNKNDEKARVAGVYINRLNKDMLLQADPTLVFALKKFDLKRILDVHKEVNSPYNTYKYTGLPPGPINLPAANTLDAVLNYEVHPYYYFCAKEDFSGYHNFAETYEAHLKNARLYQKALNKSAIY